MKIELLERVDSTNRYIKQYLERGENTIVCARTQTAGQGTKGRSFLSDAGGVYLSALFYPDLEAGQSFRIMAHAAVAVCRTVQDFGVTPSVKWANDVLIGEKKCCGILIENMVKEGKIHASIIGIGLNVQNDLSALSEIACSLKECVPNCPKVDAVRERLIENLLKESDFEEYLSFIGFLGRTVRVIGTESFLATAVRVLPDGRLEVERAGEKLLLSSGEISIRLEENI